MNFNTSMIMALLGTCTIVVCVSACASGDKTVIPAGSGSAAALPDISDYPVPVADDYNADLMLGNDAIDSRLMALDEPPQVTFTIWGYDELAADVSATEIKVSAFELRPQSVPYYLRFSESELQSIEFQSGVADSLRYYITMGIDVDGDGQICNGDFRQDYSVSRPERFRVSQTQINSNIQISEVDGKICAQ